MAADNMGVLSSMRARARSLKKQLFVLYVAYRDKRVPWYAKLAALAVVAYAFSPIDLIPDFIPVLGYLDDVILVPLGIALAIRLIPPAVLEDCRAKAEAIQQKGKPANWLAACLFVAIWVLAAFWIGRSIWKRFA